MLRPRRISDFKPIITNLAQTSHYQVIFGQPSGELGTYLLQRGVDPRFIGENVGLLCSSASLPGSSFATSDIVGNFTGVAEKFAHTRQFIQIDLEFYVDREYKVLKFLEHWMEFIASGSGMDPTNPGYYFRMQYPRSYKNDQTRIIKFNRDYYSEIEYTFIGLFPISLNSTSVNYGPSDILKASASFNYERYICGRTLSFDTFRNINNNQVPNQVPNQNVSNNPPLIFRTGPSLGEPGPRRVVYTPGNVNPTIVDTVTGRAISSNSRSGGGTVIGERSI